MLKRRDMSRRLLKSPSVFQDEGLTNLEGRVSSGRVKRWVEVSVSGVRFALTVSRMRDSREGAKYAKFGDGIKIVFYRR